MARRGSADDLVFYEQDPSSAFDYFQHTEPRDFEDHREVGHRSPQAERQAEQRVITRQAILPAPGRATLYERSHGYRLTLSQLHTLGDLARFRVVAVSDLREFIYRNGSDLEVRNLVRHGLVLTGMFMAPQATPRELATLAARGHRLVCSNALVAEKQSTYSGFVKTREANHDADLYRIYHREIARIRSEGGELIRVVLDYELKTKINRDLVRYGGLARPEIARSHGLSCICGKIPIPDLQIEYATVDGDVARISLELVTEHYRPSAVGQKVRAGFKLYTPHRETGRLLRLLDKQNLNAEVLSL